MRAKLTMLAAHAQSRIKENFDRKLQKAPAYNEGLVYLNINSPNSS